MVMPVLFGSAESGHGIHCPLKALRHKVPSVEVTAARRGILTDRGVMAEVFRTLFAGHTSVRRVTIPVPSEFTPRVQRIVTGR
jgi:hypothetical protein